MSSKNIPGCNNKKKEPNNFHKISHSANDKCLPLQRKYSQKLISTKKWQRLVTVCTKASDWMFASATIKIEWSLYSVPTPSVVRWSRTLVIWEYLIPKVKKTSKTYTYKKNIPKASVNEWKPVALCCGCLLHKVVWPLYYSLSLQLSIR